MKDTLRWDVVRGIWRCSSGDFYSTAMIDRLDGNRFYEELGPEDQPPKPQRFGADLYFSACGFTEPTRSNDAWASSSLLFADLDAVNPLTLALRPTWAWETSPGNFQAVWNLDTEITDYQEWASFNQRMTIYTGADRGGWMGSKLLRVPGSANFKRATEGMIPVGKMLLRGAHGLSLSYVDKVLPPPKKRQENSSIWKGCPEPVSYIDGHKIIAHAWPNLTLRGRSMLCRDTVPDRSLHIIRTIHELLNGGLDPVLIFQLIWLRPWCKWRDRNNPEQLWKEIKLAAN